MKFRASVIGVSQSGKSTAGKMLDEMCGGGYFDTADMLKEGFAIQLLSEGKVPGSLPSSAVPFEANTLVSNKDGDSIRTNRRTRALREVMRYKTDKPEYRKGMLEYGIRQEKVDPLFTVLEPLRRSCFVVGNRTKKQLDEMRKRVDWIIWIQREGVEPNVTDQVTAMDADVIIDNNGTLLDLRRRLEAFVLLYGPGTSNLERRRMLHERIEVRSHDDILPGQDRLATRP